MTVPPSRQAALRALRPNSPPPPNPQAPGHALIPTLTPTTHPLGQVRTTRAVAARETAPPVKSFPPKVVPLPACPVPVAGELRFDFGKLSRGRRLMSHGWGAMGGAGPRSVNVP